MEVYCKKFLSYEESIENYKRIFVSHGAFSTSSSTLKTSVACLAPTKAMRWMDVGKNSLSIGRSTYQNRIMYHWIFVGKLMGDDYIYPHCCISNIVPLFFEISSLEEA